jgi:hypothetical protein
MSQELLIGALLVAVAGGLIFVGLPDKAGVSPRFLRFQAALVIYPALILVFLAAGVAELITAFLRMS